VFIFDFQGRLVKHHAGMALFTQLALWRLLCCSQYINREINPPTVMVTACASSHVA
jgi:hypothetical protein